MVSDIAGTTRDAIDTAFTDEGDDFVIIDTAGIRKRSKIEDASLERYSVIRSLAAIRRCDVALLLIDAAEGVTEQDAQHRRLHPRRGHAPASSWSTSGTAWKRAPARWKNTPRRSART